MAKVARQTVLAMDWKNMKKSSKTSLRGCWRAQQAVSPLLTYREPHEVQCAAGFLSLLGTESVLAAASRLAGKAPQRIRQPQARTRAVRC